MRHVTFLLKPRRFRMSLHLCQASPDHCCSELVIQPLLTPGRTLGDNTIPANGRLLLIGAYAALFSFYGTIYGGNGTTNFAVPNLKQAARTA